MTNPLPKSIKEELNTQFQQDTSGIKADQSSKDNASEKDDIDSMSDADKKKMAELTEKQNKAKEVIQKIDGRIQKMKEPLVKRIQTMERMKARAQQELGRMTDQIESLRKKNNIQESNTMTKKELKDLIRETLLEGKKGLSGMKKTSDKKENTKMKSGDKTITKTTEPKEKTEGKKLPVVKKPKNPKGEKIKEAILNMVRDVIAESIEEMARTAAEMGEDGIVHGGIGTNNRRQDPKSPTGWSIVNHKKFPDGTPCDAPKNTGANYVKKGDNPNMGRPTSTVKQKKMANSPTITVNINGKAIGQFDLSQAEDTEIFEKFKEFVQKKVPAIEFFDDSVDAKVLDFKDMLENGSIPDNAVLDAVAKKNPSRSGVTTIVLHAK